MTPIPLQWSDSGPRDQTNAFGTVLHEGSIPIICGHGGSRWLCRKCADAILAHREREKIESTMTWDNLV